MKAKYYIASAISVLSALLYFTPWLMGANRGSLALYILGVLWFFVGWIPLIVQGVLGIKQKIDGGSSWKHHIIAALIIAGSYLVIFIGMFTGRMVTV